MGRVSKLSGLFAGLLLLGGNLSAAPRYPTIDEAIARGDLADVRAHVAGDPEIAPRPRERGLPLHQAILRNKTEIALFLLESGASVDAPDRTARTPLHLAVERGNVALVTALLERKARPNERDGIGWTPLHHAAAENKVTASLPSILRSPMGCVVSASFSPPSKKATRHHPPAMISVQTGK